jgi:hypothetical protein
MELDETLNLPKTVHCYLPITLNRSDDIRAEDLAVKKQNFS